MKSPASGLPASHTVFAVVLAGGQGTRLWPISRRARPKQFLKLCEGGGSLLQEAVRRAEAMTGSLAQVLVASMEEQAPLVRADLPDLPESNLILEPTGRSTAACLGLAARRVLDQDPQGLMAVFPADHIYREEAAWLDAMQTAVNLAEQSGRLVAVGIRPESPSSSYGYLQLGSPLPSPGPCPAYEIRSFLEKPKAQVAAQLVEQGDALWNTGTYAWQAEVFWKEVGKHMPALRLALDEISSHPERMAQVYAQLQPVSVDYGIMEKASGSLVVLGSHQRLDVGSLASLSELFPQDEMGNTVRGELAAKDSQGNLVYTDHGLVGLIGVEDLVVVRQGDIVLVCPRERAGEVRDLVAQLAERGLDWYR